MKNSSLFSLIKSALPDFNCKTHRLSYSKINASNMELLCDRCECPEGSQKIEQFFDSPLRALLCYHNPKQIDEISQNLLQLKTMSLVRKKLKNSKQVLNNYLTSLENSVKQQCQFMRESYESLTNQVIAKVEQNFEYIQEINKVYREQFEEGLDNIKDGESLKQTINEFINKNQNPTDSLTNKLETVQRLLRTFPYLKIDKLKELYTSTCDPYKWQLQNYMSNYQDNCQSIILETNLIRLSDRQHMIRYDNQYLEVLDYSLSKTVSKYSIDIDYGFQIQKFRVVVNNDRQIQVYSYLNPEELKVIATVTAKYPTELKYYRNKIFYISEHKLFGLDLESKQIEIIALNVREYRIDQAGICLRKQNQYFRALSQFKLVQIDKQDYSQIV